MSHLPALWPEDHGLGGGGTGGSWSRPMPSPLLWPVAAGSWSSGEGGRVVWLMVQIPFRPPVNRRTDTSENITLPLTTYRVGNNIFIIRKWILVSVQEKYLPYCVLVDNLHGMHVYSRIPPRLWQNVNLDKIKPFYFRKNIYM